MRYKVKLELHSQLHFQSREWDMLLLECMEWMLGQQAGSFRPLAL
jgi:hypothetical protein